MDNLCNYTSRQQLGIEVFNDDQCAMIHQAILEVLKEVGVDVYNDKALEILKKAGAFVDGRRVRFPAAMVESAIQSAPSQVTLYSQDMESKMILGGKDLAPPLSIHWIHTPVSGKFLIMKIPARP